MMWANAELTKRFLITVRQADGWRTFRPPKIGFSLRFKITLKSVLSAQSGHFSDPIYTEDRKKEQHFHPLHSSPFLDPEYRKQQQQQKKKLCILLLYSARLMIIYYFVWIGFYLTSFLTHFSFKLTQPRSQGQGKRLLGNVKKNQPDVVNHRAGFQGDTENQELVAKLMSMNTDSVPILSVRHFTSVFL